MSLPKGNFLQQTGWALDPTMNGTIGPNWWAKHAAEQQAAANAKPPTPPPDLADALSKSSQENSAMQLLATGRGQRSTFLTGPSGSMQAPVLSSPKLGGA